MKRARTYWIQILYKGEDEQIGWIESFGSYSQTIKKASEYFKYETVDYILILRPWVREGALAPINAIKADLQREAKPGANVIKVK